MYKKKKDKVRPVNILTLDGTKPGGIEDQHKKAVREEKRKGYDRPQSYFDKYLTPKFLDIPQGLRLTIERIIKLKIGEDLQEIER